MRNVQFTNNAVSRLAANITSTATTLTVTPGDGSKFPTLTGSAYFYCTLIKSDGSAEVIKVTARSTDTFTIVRAVEAIKGATLARSFAAGDRVEIRLTAGAFVTELDRLEEIALISVLTKSADYTVTEGNVNSLIRADTTGGTLTLTLPQISTLNGDFDLLVTKITGDASSVIIQRAGTDLINGATTYQLSLQYQCAWLICDRATGQWNAINSGAIAGNNIVVEPFTGDGTANALTLSGNPGSKNNINLYIGGVYQRKSTFTWSGTSITPGGVIATGVAVEAVWQQPTSIGIPSDGSVSTIKINDEAVTAEKLAAGVAATNLGLSQWAVVEDAGVLYFKYAGANKFKIDSTGNLTVTGNVTAFGTV